LYRLITDVMTLSRVSLLITRGTQEHMLLALLQIVNLLFSEHARSLWVQLGL